jgi:HPt (histidine-containing phosphotransfer) domain-containing protein
MEWPLNLKTLAEEVDLEEEEYREMMGLFAKTTCSDLGQLHSAITGGDSRKAREAAHSIKGAAGSLGLKEIYGVAKTIEDKARADNLEGLAEMTADLQKRIEAIASVLGS